MAILAQGNAGVLTTLLYMVRLTWGWRITDRTRLAFDIEQMPPFLFIQFVIHLG